MASTKGPWIKTMEKIIKLIQESNKQWSVMKDVSSSQSAVSSIWCKYKRNEVVKKEKKILLVDYKRNERVNIENSK